MSAVAVPGEHPAAGPSRGAGQGTTADGPASPLTRTRAVVEAVRAVMVAAPSAEAATWSWEERAQTIAALDRVSELVGVYRAGLLAAHKADRGWSRTGDRSFEGFRGRTAKTGFGAARREMELAEGLQQMPQAARAVEDGQVGLAHAEVLSRVRARGSEPVRRALDAGGADELISMARQMDASAFAKRADAWAASQDAAAVERSHQQVRARRACRIVDREGGTRVEAFLDPIAGATLRTALEALTPVPSAGDDRSSDQRRADALSAMASRVLDRGADKIGAQIRPHISVIVPGETWAGIRERARVRAAGGGARAGGGSGNGQPTGGGQPTDGGQPMGDGQPADGGRSHGAVVMPELDDGTVVPLSEIERIACDCELTRVVLSADGVPLDVGRTERHYTKALRRAVLVRDRHCRWPGCTMRASWCDVHHIRWYSRGGGTSLANGLTLCSFHHHEVHRRDITITTVAGGHRFTLRDGADLGVSKRHSPDTALQLIPDREQRVCPDDSRPGTGVTKQLRTGTRAIREVSRRPSGAPAGVEGGNGGVSGREV